MVKVKMTIHYHSSVKHLSHGYFGLAYIKKVIKIKMRLAKLTDKLDNL